MKATADIQPLTAATNAATQTSAQAGALRILHVVNRLDTGGTEHGILNVIAGLRSREFEHRLCTIRGYCPGFERLAELQHNVLVAGRADERFQFPLFKLAQIMKEYRPHVVHSRNWGAIEAVLAARMAGVPVIVHSEHGYELDQLRGLPVRRRLARRAAYFMADAVFAVSEELRAFHEQQAGVRPGRIGVVRNGVDTERFAPHQHIRAETRAQLNLPDNSFVIGTVGRLVPIKDHKTLLRAARMLAERGVDVRVLIVGAGPELSALERQVSAASELAGRVAFLGNCGNIPAILNALNVFVLPSISEGMSNTILEAMGSGLPVMATRVGGNPELVEEGRTGWLFSPGDAQGLAEKLAWLSGNRELLREFGAAARARAVTEFSMDRMIAEYRRLYLRLAQEHGIVVEVRA